jgi:hypothetical protein
MVVAFQSPPTAAAPGPMTDATLSRETFRDRLRALSDPTFARLVADLWERRGWSASVDGRRVHVAGDAGAHTLLLYRDGDDPDWEGVDRAITDGTASDDAIPVPVTTPTDLFEFARYALDRPDCDALFAEYFDARPPERRPPPEALPPRDDSTQTGLAGGLADRDETDGFGGRTDTSARPAAGPPRPEPPGDERTDTTASGRRAEPPDETATETGDDGATERDAARSNRRVVGGALAVLVVLLFGAIAGGGLGGVAPGGTDAVGGGTATPLDAGGESTERASGGVDAENTETAADAPTPNVTATATVTPTPTDEQTTTAASAPGTDGRRSYLSLSPTCDRPPGLVVAVQLGIFREAGEDPRRAAESAWPYLSRLAQQFVGTPRDYARILASDVYSPLLGHEQVTYGPIERSDRTVVQPVTVVANGTEASYEFVVSKTGGDDTGAPACWRISNVSRLDDPATNASDAGRDSVPGVGPGGGRPAAVGAAAP